MEADVFAPPRESLRLRSARRLAQKISSSASDATLSPIIERLGIADLKQRMHELEERVYWHDNLFYKAFSVAGVDGDFAEFGVFEGGTLSMAYWSMVRWLELFRSGHWDRLTNSDCSSRMIAGFDRMRFFGFDSFKGIPKLNGPDAQIAHFNEGEYSAPQEKCLAHMRTTGVPAEKIVLVPGFFSESCTPENAKRIGLERLGVVHIDSDLYQSAIEALTFCTPYLHDGSVVIFDEWFAYSGNPDFGEQRAMREWLERNPDWRAAELAREGSGRIAFVLTKR